MAAVVPAVPPRHSLQISFHQSQSLPCFLQYVAQWVDRLLINHKPLEPWIYHTCAKFVVRQICHKCDACHIRTAGKPPNWNKDQATIGTISRKISIQNMGRQIMPRQIRPRAKRGHTHDKTHARLYNKARSGCIPERKTNCRTREQAHLEDMPDQATRQNRLHAITKRMPDYLPAQAVSLKRKALPDQGTRPFKFEKSKKTRPIRSHRWLCWAPPPGCQ